MIGFDATNSLGQGLAAREKIFSFTLAYFTFINDSIPALSFVIKTENNQDIVSFVSSKLVEYFENFIVQSESAKNENGELINPNDKSALAKYYLASIYYYEPSFDFTSLAVPDIYNLGKTYLLEMFSENVSLLLEKSRKYADFRIPNFPESTDKDLWKYFTYAMLATEYNAQYINIVQQSVSLASRSGQYLFDYIGNYLTAGVTKFQDFYGKELTTHENKKIEATLSNFSVKKYSASQVYNSINWYLVGSWQNLVNRVIDLDDDEIALQPDNTIIARSQVVLNSMKNWAESVNPQKLQNFTEQDRKNLYQELINSIEVARSEYGNTLDVLNSNDYDKNVDSNGKNLFPYDGSIADLISPGPYTTKYDGQQITFSYNPLNTRNFIDSKYATLADLKIEKILIFYLGMIYGFNSILKETNLNDVNGSFWEDSPNIIKSFIKAGNVNYSLQDFIEKVLFVIVPGLTGYKKYTDWDGWKWIGTQLYETYKKNPEQFVFIGDSYINTNYSFPSGINLYNKDLFITYFVNAGVIEYPEPKNNIDLSAFFEFSFQPNLQRIKEKFPNKINISEEDLIFKFLKDNYFLNFSKTETYVFLEKLIGKELVQSLTIEEFSSLFDIYVSLQHKVVYTYLDPKFSSGNLAQNIKNMSSYFDNTNYSFRRWINLNSNAYSRNLILYNPLANPSKNSVKNSEESLQTNASVKLGSSSDFNVDNIAIFNPVETFKDDELIYKFISVIENTPIGTFLKNNYNFMPYDFSEVGKNLIVNKVSSLPENFIINNNALFVNSHSELSKNLINNLITSIQEMKEE